MFRVTNEFTTPTEEDWRTLAAASLKGAPLDKLSRKTRDELTLKPIYLRDNMGARGSPGSPPFTRGRTAVVDQPARWILCQEIRHPTREAIAGEIAGGSDALHLLIEDSTTLEDLDALLEGVDLAQVNVALVDARFREAAALTVALAEKRATAPSIFLADPLGSLAQSGQMVRNDQIPSDLATLAKWSRRSMRVSTTPYHNAGATVPQELGIALATGVEYLRALTDGGLPLDDAAEQIAFSFDLGRDFFTAIAQLRAVRSLWSAVLKACGARARGAYLYARTSERTLTVADPNVNMLRATLGTFAAAVGGADAITTLPYDAAYGQSDLGRRLARNTQLMLAEETHLGHVIDPAGGSWYVETLTRSLEAASWSRFQAIEERGGMTQALADGYVQDQIEEAYAATATKIARRKIPITGVSEFPDLAETLAPPHREDTVEDTASQRAKQSLDALIQAARDGASLADLSGLIATQKRTVRALPKRRWSEPFEALRFAADTQRKKDGQRPCFLQLDLGTLAETNARSTFLRNFLAAGGLDLSPPGTYANVNLALEALKQSKQKNVAICAPDEIYQTVLPLFAKELKAAGAKVILLAGHPKEREPSWREAGIDAFCYLSCDALAILSDLQEKLGVSR